MKRLLFLIVCIPFFCFSQKYVSKVSAINGQSVKIKASINVTDSIITITQPEYTYEFIVENQVKHYYQLDLYGNKYNLTIASVEGRSLGFKYTTAFTLLDVAQQQPSMIYYAIKEEEQ